jgi:hypothetical protein
MSGSEFLYRPKTPVYCTFRMRLKPGLRFAAHGVNAQGNAEILRSLPYGYG